MGLLITLVDKSKEKKQNRRQKKVLVAITTPSGDFLPDRASAFSSHHLHYIVSHLQLAKPSVDPTAPPPLTLCYQEKETSEHLGYLLNERNYHWLFTQGPLTDVISTFILSSSFSSLFNCLDSL